MRLPRRTGAAILLLATAPAATAGCAAFSDHGLTCLSWVQFATPADALDHAELVVTARVLDQDGTESLYGIDATAWTVTTDERAPLRGEVPTEPLRVISTPVTCEAGGPYPDGDPLDTDDTLVLFLTRDEAGNDWRTLTPRHGALPAGPSGELPRGWPQSP